MTRWRKKKCLGQNQCAKILFVRWDLQVCLWQVLCDPWSCHNVELWKGGDGSEDREPGTSRSSVPATKETANCSQEIFAMSFQSHGQIPRNLLLFRDICQTGEHGSILLINCSCKLLAQLLHECLCAHISNTVMSVFFRDISGCILNAWNMMLKQKFWKPG